MLLCSDCQDHERRPVVIAIAMLAHALFSRRSHLETCIHDPQGPMLACPYSQLSGGHNCNFRGTESGEIVQHLEQAHKKHAADYDPEHTYGWIFSNRPGGANWGGGRWGPKVLMRQGAQSNAY
jgi:hypothetical protein